MFPKKSHLVDFGYFQIDQIEVMASLTQNNIFQCTKILRIESIFL